MFLINLIANYLVTRLLIIISYIYIYIYKSHTHTHARARARTHTGMPILSVVIQLQKRNTRAFNRHLPFSATHYTSLEITQGEQVLSLSTTSTGRVSF